MISNSTIMVNKLNYKILHELTYVINIIFVYTIQSSIKFILQNFTRNSPMDYHYQTDLFSNFLLINFNS